MQSTAILGANAFDHGASGVERVVAHAGPDADRMAALKLNLLHLLLLLSAAGCLYYAMWEGRQRTLALKKHFRSSGFAIVAALVLVFFQVGMKQPLWPFLAAVTAGLVVGVASGFVVKLRVDRSWQIPRPAGTRRMIWFAALLAAAAAVDIASAAIGPEARPWRFYAALGAVACAGVVLGRALAVGVRVWRLIG